MIGFFLWGRPRDQIRLRRRGEEGDTQMATMMSMTPVTVRAGSSAPVTAPRRAPVRMAAREQQQGVAQKAAALAVAGMLSASLSAGPAMAGDQAAALALAQAKLDAVNSQIETKQVNRMTRDGAVKLAPKNIVKTDPLAEKPLQLNAILSKGIQFDKFGAYSASSSAAAPKESTGSFLDNYLGGILFVGAGVIFTPLLGLALGGSSEPAPALPARGRSATKRVGTKKVASKGRK